MSFLHSVRDVVIKDQWLWRDAGKGRNAITTLGSEGQDRNYVSGARKHCYKALRQILRLEVMQQAVGISIRLQKMTGHYGMICSFQNERRDIISTALRKGRWWCYTWTGLQLIREPLRMSDHKEEAAGAVGENSLWQLSHREGMWKRPQTSKAQHSEIKKWWYAYRLFGMNRT